MKNNLLEVGDELFYYQGFSQNIKRFAGKVDRVTKTLAFVGTLKLKRSLAIGFTASPGDSGYAVRTYRLITEEIREEIKEFEKWVELAKPLKILIDNGRGSINYLTNSQLERINAILAEVDNG